MSYDLYIQKPKGDPATKVRLLVAESDPLGQYLQTVHHKKKAAQAPYAKQLIAPEIARMECLGLFKPGRSDFQSLPVGSWFLQFTFTLAKPWMSKDDDPFYVSESVNPVRKDKVFKVPFMAASGWKGLLRWTAMRVRLYKLKDKPGEFAEERFRQTLLFGNEKGEEPGVTKDFAAYLDRLGGKEAKQTYEQKVRAYFQVSEEEEGMPHHAGRLMFYPTFFDLIDVEVINPHSRETKAGTHPIYLECVPAGAKGTFSLLYVPFDLIGRKSEDEIRAEARGDLKRVAEATSAMMLIYGFSAKRTSGYGMTEDEIEGIIKTKVGECRLTHLSRLAEEVANAGF